MRSTRLLAAAVSAALVAAAVPLVAQSLGDVAKKEEERRKTVQQPAKVYTNNDLGSIPASATPPPASAATAAEPDKGSDKKDADAKDKDKDKEPAKDKAFWASRKKTLQDAVDRDQTYADALQSRINALSADFVNRDDPAQRAVIERDRQKAVAELQRLTKQIQDDKKALADLDEEARRAGVPPGWMR